MASVKPASEEFQTVLTYDRSGYNDQQLIDLYHSVLLPRMIEEKMLNLLRQGKISKWFSGIGQEAIAAGAATALRGEDYILPLHRNLGVFVNRKMDLVQLFAQWQGKPGGFTKGRDRSFHFGSPEHRVFGMISHLGAMLPVADGLSLASNLDGEEYISLVFSGDGGASEGDFHEAINVAAVWELPVIFLIENNGYGLSTPSDQQYNHEHFIDKAHGYGLEGYQIDGNNVIEVHRTITALAEKMRKDRKPVILECMTFRMRGHEEASGTKYVPPELFEEWGRKDPVLNFEGFLKQEGVLTVEEIRKIHADYKKLINAKWAESLELPDTHADTERELTEVYAPSPANLVPMPDSGMRELRFVDAVKEGLYQALEQNDRVVVMGQDVAEYGGVFKVTEGFVEKFGNQRVRNTPLCESAILGAGMGLSLRDRPAVVEMQFADFVSCGFNQIVNNLAKTHYRWGSAINVTVRMPTGAGAAAGPFHSQSNEAWFAKVPGLKVVFPATPADAKGLLTASVLEPNPVLFFEHKALYRSVSGMVPEAYYNLPLGKAALVREGEDMSIVTYGWGVHKALEMAEKLSGDYSIEVIDLRTLLPWDRETVFESVKKTGKCFVLHEDTLTMGIGGEIAATIAEEMFEHLDGPVRRLGSLDTPVPFHKELEDDFLPWDRLEESLLALLEY